MGNSFNSKQKGSNYERKVAKLLSSWWGSEFHRTPASGGLRWGEDNNVAGDIVTPPSANFPYVIECKNREGGWTLESIVLDKHDIKNWWAQVVADARRVKKTPVLIFTRNRAEDFIMLPFKEDMYQKLEENDKPAMRTYIEYTDDLTTQKERFDILITTMSGLTQFDKDYVWDNAFEDWEDKTRLTKDIEPPVENLDDLVDKLKK